MPVTMGDSVIICQYRGLPSFRFGVRQLLAGFSGHYYFSFIAIIHVVPPEYGVVGTAVCSHAAMLGVSRHIEGCYGVLYCVAMWRQLLYK